MRTVYAIHYELPPNPGETAEDVVRDVRRSASDWLVNRLQRKWSRQVALPFDGEWTEPADGHRLCTTARRVGDSELVTYEWVHPHDRDPTTQWQTHVVVGRHGDAVEIAVSIRVMAVQSSIRPIDFVLGRPRLITELLGRYRARISGWEVPRDVEVVKAAEVETYVKGVLLSPARCLPVVMASPDPWTDQPVVAPAGLFDSLRGFAHVAVLQDKWAAFKLTEVVGKEWSCFNGAARLYWPGLSTNADPFEHGLFMPDVLRSWSDRGASLERRLFRHLASVSAFRAVEGPAIRAARKEVGDSDRSDMLRLAEEVRQGKASQERVEEELLKALYEIDQLREERDRLREELEAQRQAWTSYPQVMEVDDERSRAGAAAGSEQRKSLGEVVRAAKAKAGTAVVYLDSALRSAEESPFKSVARVEQLLEAIEDVAAEWVRKGGALGRSWEDAFGEKGFEYKSRISKTSKGKWASDYEFKVDGEKHLFEKHITIGSGQADTCLSVHWWLDEGESQKDKAKKRRRLVIGHIGRHLTNTKT